MPECRGEGAAQRGCQGEKAPLTTNRIIHQTVKESFPQPIAAAWHQARGDPKQEPYPWSGVLLTYARSAAAVRALKDRYGEGLSTNDVICGELAERFGVTQVPPRPRELNAGETRRRR